MPKGQRGRAICVIEDCGEFVDAHGLCHKHAERKRRTGDPLGSTLRDPEERFMSKVLVAPDGCWLWQASLNPKGYGWFSVKRRMCYAHIWSYTHFVGPVPDGLELDHLCRVRHCVNPAHLEPVTHQENVRRGEVSALRDRPTHCKHGHEFTPENTRWNGNYRTCKACGRAASLRYLERSKAT